MDQKQIAELMRERLISSAKNNAEKIHEFFKHQYVVEVSNYEEILKNEIALYKEKELGELQELNFQMNAKANISLRNELFIYRDEKVDALFDGVRNELISFANSNKYEQYLKDKLKKVSSSITTGIIKVRKEDTTIMKKLAPKMEVVVDTNILVGGFICVSEYGKREYDATLDEALNDARSWFEDSSHLIL